MRLHVDDDSFVRAPAGLVYRRLTHIQAWPEWWPGLAVRPVLGPANAWTLEFGRKPRRLRLHAVAGNWRHDQGFVMRVSGDLEGTIEFWLEADDPGATSSGQGQPLDGGTVIHVVTSAETAGRRPLQTAKRLRRSVRAGMWGFKDRVQGEVREMIGLDQ
jgi:hypothetical protein